MQRDDKGQIIIYTEIEAADDTNCSICNHPLGEHWITLDENTQGCAHEFECECLGFSY